MAESFFDGLDLAPPDAIWGLVAEFKADQSPDKVNLIVGAYRTEEGEPYILPVVKSVESAMAADKTLNHEYLPIEGLKDLTDAAVRLCLGEDSPAITENRVCASQALSGTGSLKLAFELLFRNYSNKTVLLPKETWGNHPKILKMTGYTDVRRYRYFDADSNGLNIMGLLEDLESFPDGSVLVLHPCAHNPSGVDPSKEEWKSIADIAEKKKLLVLFDMAYQGFVSGDPDTDAWAVRYFVERGLELFVCQSFAKIFGIYNERAGSLTVVCKNSTLAMHVLSHLKAIVRPMYSNPPNHGARIVATILNNNSLAAEWREQLKGMAERITRARNLLLEKLKAIETPGKWNHIIDQNGMFTYTGLKPKQVAFLKEKYHIFMLGSGRINMCAITPHNVEYVAQAFKDTVVTCTE